MISAIIYAGLLAPFAAAAVGGSGKEYFRQFFCPEERVKEPYSSVCACHGQRQKDESVL
jgi:hypothetical protein